MNKTFQLSQGIIEITEGDITNLKVDAIVNAANSNLILGGGVAGAIRQRGGPAIQEQCNQIGGTFVGGAVRTTAGQLPANYVIHAVGPMMGEGEEDNKLKNATKNSLRIASESKMNTIAFPAISTGIFGYPVERCARIMIQEVQNYLLNHAFPAKVIFCLWGQYNYKIFEKTLLELIKN